MSTNPRDSRLSQDVFVLGAGFSRAISEHMPLTSDLFEPCLAAMRDMELETVHDGVLLGAYERLGSNIETWLTWLASDQPWLSEAGSLRNRAAFADVSRALASVILESQNRAMQESGGGPPPWLHGVVNAWANDGTTVIAFNYDTLVEKTYEIVVPQSAPVLYSFPLAGLSGGARLGGQSSFRFEFFKLHGSIGWYVFPRDSREYGPVYDAGFTRGWPKTDDQAELLLKVGGRQPLIVPPVVSKDPFFGRAELRDQWLRADYRLQRADRLFLLGYSMPDADLTVRFLLDRTAPTCELVPVDISTEVVERIRRLTHPRPCDPRFSGRPRCLEEFATTYATSRSF